MKSLYNTAKQRRPSFFILCYSILKCNNTYRDHYKQTAKLYKSILITLNYGTKMRKYINEQIRSRREAGPQRRKTNEAVCSSNGHRWLSQHPVSLLVSLNRQLMVS